jgi:hypothetical protein
MEVKMEVKGEVNSLRSRELKGTISIHVLKLSSSLFAGLTSCLTPYLTSIYNSRKLNEIYNQAIYSPHSHSSMEL